MIKSKLFISLLSILIVVNGSDTKCDCQGLKSENDCLKYPLQSCIWMKQGCYVSTPPATQPVIVSKPFCSQYKSQENCQKAFICSTCQNKQIECQGCLKQYPCIWESNQCLFFTGCTAYLNTNPSECNRISKQCTSDQIQCIEIGECQSYITQEACKQKNIHGKSCTWDGQFNTCKELTYCSDIPTEFAKSHEGCYGQLNHCTVKSKASLNDIDQCIELQADCINYTIDQCKLTSSGVLCTWSNNSCRETSCEDAPLSYDSKDKCQSFMPICTIKSGGGCQKIIYCQDLTKEQDCQSKVDTNGKTCFWRNQSNDCAIYECENAPLEYQYDSMCAQFKPGCISNEGSGCKLNKGCSAILTQQECNTKRSAEDKECMWDEVCKEKTCENIKKQLTSHQDCEKFLFNCTTNQGIGCQDKTCKNAPDTMKTNEDCEKYLPDHHCITRSGGGCTQNDSCQQISIEIACIKDINGSDCYWNDVSKQCITMQCDKAPADISDQSSCESFWSKCQVNASGTGCEDKVCENFREEDKCKFQADFYGNSCSWKNKCVEKKCETASQEFKTHEECNIYLNTCTLSLTGKGCMSFPLRCEFIKLEQGCRMRTSIGLNNQRKTKECAWKKGICQDKTCETAPITIDSNDACNLYLPGCYMNNERKGCWKLPECSQRRIQEICGFEATYNYDCVWDMATSTCSTRTCLSTLLDTQNYKSVQSCQEYKLNASNCSKPNGVGCCTLNDQGNGCMKKPDNCYSLKSQGNCGEKALFSDENCYWDPEKKICQPNDCGNLKLPVYDHASCYITSFKKCTADEKNTQCIQLQNSCSSYKPTDQCKIDFFGNECVIRLNSVTNTYTCDQEKCGDVTAATYNSFAACQSYNQACTVIARVGSRGCVNREFYCFYYKFQGQCVKNLAGKQCVWNNNRCWDYDSVECTQIKGLLNYSTADCENIISYCRANQMYNGCIKKTCNDYNTITKVTGGAQVSKLSDCWNITFNNIRCSINKALNACVEEKDRCNQYENKIEECYSSRIEGLCMVVGTKCYQKNTSCNLWSSNNDLGCQQFREFCKYPDSLTGKQACINRTCEEKTGIGLTEQICQDYDQTCTVSKDQTMCILIQSSCGSYKQENFCVKSTSSNCLWQTDTTSECIGITNLTEAEKFCKYRKTKSYDECQTFSKFCSINRLQTECVAQKQCASQTIPNCYKNANEYCIQTQIQDANAICTSPNPVTCNNIFLGQTTLYTQELCSKVKNNCTNQGNTGCTDKTCQNAISHNTHEDCSNWKSSCTVNNARTGCYEMKNKCLDQDINSCFRTITDGECIVNMNTRLCVKKTCYSNIDAINDAQCETYMSTCTIAQPSGCMFRQPCQNYITELSCVTDNLGSLCFWNPSLEQCVTFSCDKIEYTSKFDTHDECYNLDNIQAKKENKFQRCTVRIVPDPIDKTVLNKIGCINLQNCSDYKYEEQCVIDQIGQYCYWNKDNPEKKYCQMRTCSSAPSSFQTDEECSKYLLSENTQYQDKCTVSLEYLSPNTYLIQGCKSRAGCEEYVLKDQCRYSSTGLECKWEDEISRCYTKQCDKAPSNLTTHQLCNDFSSKCTVNSAFAGCIEKTPQCYDYSTQDQCIQTSQGTLCFWNGILCVARHCSFVPENFNGNCSSYLDTCESSGNQRCVITDCEQYSFATDAACKAAGFRGKCTTDGFRCVERKSCEEARTEDACRVNNQNQQCVWNKPTATSDGYCEISICESASKQNYVSEKQCASLNSICTLKKSGGCKLLSDCNSFETEAGCRTSKDGKICIWDKEKGCRSNDCSDLIGTDHFKCKQQNNKCTTSQNGKCVYMTATCAEYLIEGSCVETSDGLPCLWIKALSDLAHPQGQCIQYMKCEDIPLKTDVECKSVFSTCTSNGSTCIPIQKCEKLNSVSCSLGSDGKCMLALKDATSTTKICMKFNQCQDAYYKTHQECQEASKSCTTNGQNCISLETTCKSYTDRSSCYIISQTNESSTSTGNCIWDGSCRDEQCVDINGATHQYCNSKMKSCTSDGSKCTNILTCESYQTQALCDNAYGKSNEQIIPCYWTDITKDIGQFCKPKSCKDILPASTFTCEAFFSCTYDASKLTCINKEKDCNAYTDQTACDSGTLDSKTCYWNVNKCSYVSKCQDIVYQTKCLSTKGCSYLTQNNISSCVPQNCNTVYQMTNSCKFYESFQNQFYICSLQNGECKQADPDNLTPDNCLINSNYTYTWNTWTSRCTACLFQPNSTQTNNSHHNNTDTDTDNNSTHFAQIISITCMLLAIILQ